MQGSMLVDFTEEDDDDINEVARATEEIYDQINLLQKRERQKERELQKAEAIRVSNNFSFLIEILNFVICT